MYLKTCLIEARQDFVLYVLRSLPPQKSVCVCVVFWGFGFVCTQVILIIHSSLSQMFFQGYFFA